MFVRVRKKCSELDATSKSAQLSMDTRFAERCTTVFSRCQPSTFCPTHSTSQALGNKSTKNQWTIYSHADLHGNSRICRGMSFGDSRFESHENLQRSIRIAIARLTRNQRHVKLAILQLVVSTPNFLGHCQLNHLDFIAILNLFLSILNLYQRLLLRNSSPLSPCGLV